MSTPLTASGLQAGAIKLENEWSRLHAKRPRLLYHYTDAQGLLGMLKTHRLWATNRRFMNDPTEAEYAATVIRNIVKGRDAESHLAAIVANKKRRQMVSDRVTKAINQILAWYVDDDEHYLICFCENGDLLSQWRGYGSVGGGYAVGFLAAHLGLIHYENRQKPEPVLRKVIYDAKLQQQLTIKWVKFIIGWQSFCL